MSILCLVIQGLLLLVYIFGDIGFDHPGRFGLEWNAFVVLAIAYLFFLLFGLACAVSERRWWALMLQIAMPAALFAYENRPYPQYSAKDHQHLISKSKEEVESILGTLGRGSGTGTWRGQIVDHFTYGAMCIYFSNEGRVIAVEDLAMQP